MCARYLTMAYMYKEIQVIESIFVRKNKVNIEEKIKLSNDTLSKILIEIIAEITSNESNIIHSNIRNEMEWNESTYPYLLIK